MTIHDEELPGMPAAESVSTPFENVVFTTRKTLEVVRERIDKCVSIRAEVNAEIKGLRADEDRLTRMLKIGDAPGKTAET